MIVISEMIIIPKGSPLGSVLRIWPTVYDGDDHHFIDTPRGSRKDFDLFLLPFLPSPQWLQNWACVKQKKNNISSLSIQ